MDFISGVFQWCRDNPGILGIAAAVISGVVSVIGYAIAAARWAFSLHSLVQSVADRLKHLNSVIDDVKETSGRDSGEQWDELQEHRKILAFHGEELAGIRPIVESHGREIERLNERLSDG